MAFDLANGIGVAPSPSSAGYGRFKRRWRDRMMEICPLTGDQTIYIAAGVAGGAGTLANPYTTPTPTGISSLIASEHPGSGQRLLVRINRNDIFRLDHTISNPTTARGIRVLSGLGGPVSIGTYTPDPALVNTNWGGLFVRKPIVTGCVPLFLLRDSGDPTRPDAVNYPNVWKVALPAGREFGISNLFVPSRDGLDRPWVKIDPDDLSGTDAQKAATVDASGIFLPRVVANTTNPNAPQRILRCGGPTDTKTRWDRAFCYDAANNTLWLKIPDDMQATFGGSGLTMRANLFPLVECVLEFPEVVAGQGNSGIYINKNACRVDNIASIGWGPGPWDGGNTQTAPILFDQVATGCGTRNSCFYSAAHTYHALINPGSVVYLHGECGYAQRGDATEGDPNGANGFDRHRDGATLVNSYSVGGNQHVYAQVTNEYGVFPYDNQFPTRGRTGFAHTNGDAFPMGLHIFEFRTTKRSIFGPRSHGNANNIPVPTTRAHLDEHGLIYDGCVHLANGQSQKFPAAIRGMMLKDCVYDLTMAASRNDAIGTLGIANNNDAVIQRCKMHGRFIINLDETAGDATTALTEISFVRRSNVSTENRGDVLRSDISLWVPDQPLRNTHWCGRLNAEGVLRMRFVKSVLGFQGANQLRAFLNQDCGNQTIGDAEPFTGGYRNCGFASMASSLVPELSNAPVWLGQNVPLYGSGIGSDRTDFEQLDGDPSVVGPPGTTFETVNDVYRFGDVRVPSSFWSGIGAPDLPVSFSQQPDECGKDYESQLWEAIYTRLVDGSKCSVMDTDNPLVSGVYNISPPDAIISGPEPFVQFVVQSDTNTDGFPHAVRDIVFVVNVYVPMNSAAITDPYARGASINRAVKGDWHQQVSRLPSYGLDRYMPDESPNDSWDVGSMLFLDTVAMHEPPDWLHWGHRFRVNMTSK
jgi:hypothetical protein